MLNVGSMDDPRIETRSPLQHMVFGCDNSFISEERSGTTYRCVFWRSRVSRPAEITVVEDDVRLGAV